MKPADRVFVAGHNGLVGSAIVRRLNADGYHNLLLRSHAELDLTNQQAVDDFFRSESPQYVFLSAAKVGGILANNTAPGDFIRENLQIELNVLDAARRYGVEKLLFLGSSCVYPKHAPQPIKETDLLTGLLEPTNEAYAIAKIAGIKMCEAYGRQYGCNFPCIMPTNLYGPNDNFDPATSHVLPALIGKFHEARITSAPAVEVWGTGTVRREFLYIDDLADACVFVMNMPDNPGLLNVGWGKDISIAELAQLVGDIVGYSGDIKFDPTKPDGTPRKLLDVSRMAALGWAPRVTLRDGIARTYEAFRALA